MSRPRNKLQKVVNSLDVSIISTDDEVLSLVQHLSHPMH
jgi:hypothetical protein